MTGKTNLSILLVLSILGLALFQLGGCGGGGSAGIVPQTGVLKLSITDKPADAYAQVVVSVREIRVVPAGRDAADDDDPALPVLAHFDTPRTIDVLKLQFIQQALGEITLPAGSYSQVRLILEPNPKGLGQAPVNYLTLKSDPATRIALTTPSAQQSGLKVLGPIEVKPGVINAFAMDFDPNTAIVARGNGGYNLKPTGIRLVRTSADLAGYGSLGGNLVSGFKDWSSATVSIKRRGAVNDSDPIAAGRIFSSYTSGRWEAPFTAFVPPTSQSASYKAFIAANGFQLYSSQAVPVVQGQMTTLPDAGLTPLH